MEISILKKYNNNKTNIDKYRLQNPEGKTVEDIEELEQLFNQGNPFPKAFREYLFIGGKFNSLGIQDGTDGNIKGLHEFYKEKMKQRGVSIERPFLIFDNFEGESFMFIYLDEGNDPQPWNFSVNEDYDDEDNGYLWKTPFGSFSEMIDYLVNNALKGLQPW